MLEGLKTALNKLKGNDMKTTKTKTHRISFQEKTPKGFVQKSFDTYKDHVEWQYGTSGAGCLAPTADEKES